MRALVVDDSADFRRLAARFIELDWPHAVVKGHDPAADGRPGRDFPWDAFDVVLLDYDLGIADGLTWLAAWRGLAVPPVIFLTAQGSEEVAVRALKAGAADYLRKDDLSRARLNAAIREALEAREAGAAAPPRGPRPATFAQVTVRSAASGTESIRIAGYRLIRKLGEGASATAYLTQPAAGGAPVVLKVLDGRLSGESGYLERFIAEYGAISRISSPHVVRIHDQGFTSEHAFIAMEYLPKGDLKSRIPRHGLPPAVAMRHFSQIARGLTAVHEAGLVHRDLKPGNLLFRDDDTLAIVDFGIARDILSASRQTVQGEVLGTPHYMSPEQGRGKPVDARSDLYSIGAILYEMLTGAPPFTDRDPMALLYKHCHEPAAPLPPGLARLEPLVQRLLAKDPAQRFQSAREVLLGP